MKCEEVVDALLKCRQSIENVAPSNEIGIYAIFTKSRDCLPGVSIPENDIIYIGMTKKSLSSRDPFIGNNSGSHSLRRSLGAILKTELNLRAVPRSAGPSPRNVKNFAFADRGEERLSDWMRKNLDYAYVEVGSVVEFLERDTIRALEPPLRLNLWLNPQKAKIEKLRNDCRLEAEASRR